MQKHVLEYIEKQLLPQLCGYNKGYSTQLAATSMLEN